MKKSIIASIVLASLVSASAFADRLPGEEIDHWVDRVEDKADANDKTLHATGGVVDRLTSTEVVADHAERLAVDNAKRLNGIENSSKDGTEAKKAVEKLGETVKGNTDDIKNLTGKVEQNANDIVDAEARANTHADEAAKTAASTAETNANKYTDQAKKEAIEHANAVGDDAKAHAETVAKDAESSANGYTDKAIIGANETAKGYADAAEKSAVEKATANAVNEADRAESNAKAHAETVAKDAEANANTYTDGRVEVANKNAERLANDAKAHANTVAAAAKDSAVSESKTYTNAKATETLNSANYYTDVQVGAEATARVEGDRQTLQSANAYTNQKFAQLDKRIGKVRNEANAGTASALAASQIPQVEATGRFSLGAGIGGYNNQQAVAVGFSTRITGNTVTKFAVTADTQHNVGFGAGVAVSW